MDPKLARGAVDPQHRIIVEAALLDRALLEADLAHQREAQAHHYRAFHLGTDAVRVDLRAAIDRDVGAMDLELALHDRDRERH